MDRSDNSPVLQSAALRWLRGHLRLPNREHRLGGRAANLLRLRRGFAALLFVLATVLAVRTEDTGQHSAVLLVAAKDLAAGTTVRPSDVRTVHAPANFVPHGALSRPDRAVGRVLASAARAGEPLTDVRLVGSDGGRLSEDPNVAAVPIRLSDPGVAELLHPGAKVDVVTLDSAEHGRRLLAGQATVITVTAPSDDRTLGQSNGRLVLISVPAELATRVAAVSLNQPVTVTLR